MCHMVVSSVTSLRHELFKLEGSHVQLIILTLFSHKMFMVSSLNDSAVFHDHYHVCVLYRRSAMGDYEYCSALHQVVHASLNDSLCTSING